MERVYDVVAFKCRINDQFLRDNFFFRFLFLGCFNAQNTTQLYTALLRYTKSDIIVIKSR